MRRLIALGLAAASLVAGSTTANAAASNPRDPGTPPPEIEIGVGQDGEVIPATPGETQPIPCAWHPGPATPDQATALNTMVGVIIDVFNVILGTTMTVQITFYSEENNLRAWSAPNNRFEQLMVADCTNATDPGPWVTDDTDWWVITPPSPEILLPDLFERATAPIDSPTLAINPPNETFVNLGMWLADRAGRADHGPGRARTAVGRGDRGGRHHHVRPR